MKRNLIIMASFFTILSKLFAGDNEPPYEIAEVYTDLRTQVLEISEEDSEGLSGKPVWTVLMETGHEKAAVTVVAVADGTASMYFSNGGGMIGLGEYSNVRSAVHSLLESSQEQLTHMKKTSKFPVPNPGQTIFYVVTPDGVFTYSAREDDLGNERDKLSPFFYEGQELITQMRIADQERRGQ